MRDFERFSGGDHQVERVTCREDLARGIEILHKLHDERWGAARPAGAFGSDRFSRFHEAVIPKLFERGALDLCWLSVRGEPISVLYNIVHAGRLYFYQSGRSLLLPKGVRPGIVLHAHAIARAIESGLSEYDFLAGPSRYKLELALATRPLVTLRAARPSAVEAARRLTELGIAGARRLKRGMHEAAQGDWARARAALIGTHEMTTPALIKVNSEPAARHSSSGPAPSAGSASAGAAGAVRKQASDGKARGGASKMPVPPRVHASEPESTERGSPGLAIDHAHLQPGG
jgi:hypothetical protein